MMDTRRQILSAALAYFGAVFAVAFGIGALRVTLVAPAIGALAAVALEVPVLLGFSWFTAGHVLRRWPVPQERRWAMGALAFAVLMVAEYVLGTLVFGQSPRVYLGAMATLPGALGLAGQVGFAVVPILRR